MSTRIALPVFLLSALAVFGTAAWMVQSSAFAERPELLGWALSLDMALLLPAAYLLLAVRLGWPRLTTIPIFIVSLVVGQQILPDDHHGALTLLELAAFPLELGVLFYVGRKVHRLNREMRTSGHRGEHFVETAETVLRRSIDSPRVVQLLLTEMSLLYYALAGWRGRVEGGFSYHRKNGATAVTAAFVFLVLVETVAVHMFLEPRLPVLAWIILGLSVYSVLYLLGDFHAARLRPVRVENGELRVRVGLRWRAVVPLVDIASVEQRRNPPQESGVLTAALPGGTNVLLRFHRPQRAAGLYGMTREFEVLALWLDDPTGFLAQMPGQTLSN